jgi:hypothetical protein
MPVSLLFQRSFWVCSKSVQFRRGGIYCFTHHVPHGCGTGHVHAGVVGPLDCLDVGAVLVRIGSVEEVEVFAHQSCRLLPFPNFFSPVGVSLVAKVFVQACGDAEKASVGNGVLVVEAFVECEDLPSQTSATGLWVPAVLLGIEDGLRQSEPRRLSATKIRQLVLGSRHGGHAPESLVIVSERRGLVGGHEGVVISDLVLHRLHGDGIVHIVAGIVPIVDEGVEHGTSLPPVVWVGKIAGHVADSVARVV